MIYDPVLNIMTVCPLFTNRNLSGQHADGSLHGYNSHATLPVRVQFGHDLFIDFCYTEHLEKSEC